LRQEVVVAHGMDDTDFTRHGDKPFRVVGILKRTGTPVDRTVHISLAGLEAIHTDWQTGARAPGRTPAANSTKPIDLTPRNISAFLVGLTSRGSAFQVQRMINDYPSEPLLAILPGAVLQELWDTIGIAEKALLAVSALVGLVGLLGMATALLTGLNERRREMAILRSVGARPKHVLALIVGEVIGLTCAGIILGLVLLYVALLLGRSLVQTEFGIHLELGAPNAYEWLLLAIFFGAGAGIGFWPAWRAYRQSLADGMTIHL
jgi:putative ABC transport system permease protein